MTIFKKRRELFTVEDYLQNVCQQILRKVKFLSLEVCPKTYHQLYTSKLLPQSYMHKEAKTTRLRGKFHFLGERVLYKNVLRRYKDLPEATRSTKTANVGAIFIFFLLLQIFSLVANREESMQICSAQSNVIITRHPTKLQPINSSSRIT